MTDQLAEQSAKLTAEEFDVECQAIADWFMVEAERIQAELATRIEAAYAKAKHLPEHLAAASLQGLMDRVETLRA